MTDDERIDDIIRSAASEYNRPPAVPRDEMWSAIQAARQHPATGPRLQVMAGGAVSGGGWQAKAPARFRVPAWVGMAAAAAILVATGVGIGRWSSRAPAGSDSEARRVADAPSLVPPVITGDGETAPAPAATAPSGTARPSEPGARERVPAGTRAQPATQPAARSREEIMRDPQIRRTGGNLQLAGGAAPQSSGISYQVAAQQHLEAAEALLTSFVMESADERMNAQFAGWAKGLLSNTRLLLDSPAGDDPRRARLLQDLELVLAQIVQLSPNAAATERELIQGSIQDGQVMTRLRTAIPAVETREITER